MANIDTLAELLEVDWVKTWSLDDDFHQYSLNQLSPGNSALVAEYNEGRRWWVVGYMDVTDIKDLAKFKS